MNVLDGLLQSLKDLTKRVSRLELHEEPRWVFLTSPLTSASWDGDTRSTTAKTLIDLSAVFAVPAGVKAISARLVASDTGSDGTATGCWLILSPNDTAWIGQGIKLNGIAKTSEHEENVIVPCNANGDVYYQCAATGALSLSVWLEIWGYYI
jgi:hypothetical protein